MQAPAWRLGKAKRDQKPVETSDCTPGPGAYSQDKFTSLTKRGNRPTSAFSFGNAVRIDTKKKNVKRELGPGAQDTPHSSKYGYSAPSQSVRLKTKSDMNRSFSDAPGPGAYTMSNTRTNVSFSFGLKTSQGKKTFEEPGPGNQEERKVVVMHRKPTQRIGSAKRMQHQASNGVPAPGKQDLIDKSKLSGSKSMPRWVFGSERRTGVNPENLKQPGPGAYEFRSSVGDLPSYAK